MVLGTEQRNRWVIPGALGLALVGCTGDADPTPGDSAATFSGTDSTGAAEAGDDESSGAENTTNTDMSGDGDGDAGDGDGDGTTSGDGDGDGTTGDGTTGDGDGSTGDGDGDTCATANPCVNGTCDDTGGTITCTCDTLWEGQFCDACISGYHVELGMCVVDESCAATDPCVNGTCGDTGGVISCACDTGYAGANCDVCDVGYHDEGGTCVVDETCTASSCVNGTCDDTGGIVVCTCDVGWGGVTCDACDIGYHLEAGACVVDETCATNPCANGTCDDSGGVVVCTCDPGWAGFNCNSCDVGYHLEAGSCVLDESCTATDPCVNGTCNDSTGIIVCDCDANWLGTNCDTCPADRYDCDGDAANGCEAYVDCRCTANTETRSCYDAFPTATQFNAPCQAGTQTCNADGLTWGPCLNQVTPVPEVCGDSIDNDCNGTPDDNADEDGDGYGICEGDCCDVLGPTCGSPSPTNPGAFEDPSDGVDNDCDGAIDEVDPTCDASIGSGTQPGQSYVNYLKAIELCNETTSTATGAAKTWGVITDSNGVFAPPRLTRADGTGNANGNQHSVRPNFGTSGAMDQRAGANFTVLSTGHAAAPGQTNPSHVTWEDQALPDSLGNSNNSVHSDWFGAVGGTAPAAPGCNQNSILNPVYNPVSLEFQVRAPTNANSFTVDLYLLSSEYPEWICDAYNDFVVVLIDNPDGSSLTGTQTANPADENLAIFDPPPAGGATYPVGVNLTGAGLFGHCNDQTTRECAVFFSGGGTGTNPTACTTGQFNGSGYDDNTVTEYYNPFANTCYTGVSGGGTGWLNLSGNVLPGEIFRIRIAIWDSGDHLFDSTILLDNWVWNTTGANPGGTPG
jgi:hypothetical protein